MVLEKSLEEKWQPSSKISTVKPLFGYRVAKLYFTLLQFKQYWHELLVNGNKILDTVLQVHEVVEVGSVALESIKGV